MPITIIQATKLTNKSRSTILRAIKAGKVSATKSDSGEYLIDAAELARVFVVHPIHNEQVKPHRMDDHEQVNEHYRHEVLEAKVLGLQMLVDELKQRLDKTEQRLDESLQAERKLMLMLTHQQNEISPAKPDNSVFDRIFRSWGAK